MSLFAEKEVKKHDEEEDDEGGDDAPAVSVFII
jgi:hypothetical protein